MGDNIISAILNIAKFKNNNLQTYSSKSNIRINAVGDLLEFYVKDAISGAFDKKEKDKELEYTKVFSCLGNQNNPPDMIIKKGDAFEIKKIENSGSAIALNSSPPKDVLHSSDSRITNACKNCEEKPWDEKDLFYVVGHVQNKIIKYLFFVQGTCYAAKKEVYNNLHEPLKKEIDSVLKSKGVEQANTVELGKVKKADPLGITDLRIRGMWHIQNPIKVYSEYCKLGKNNFSLFVLMSKDKYDSLPDDDIKKLQSDKHIDITDIKIKDPNNPAKLMNAKLIYFGF